MKKYLHAASQGTKTSKDSNMIFSAVYRITKKAQIDDQQAILAAIGNQHHFVFGMYWQDSFVFQV